MSHQVTIPIPQIDHPDFWLANLAAVHRYLECEASVGKTYDIGTSCLGFPIFATEYNPEASVSLMVVGGTHGHEPGGVAAAMNLIHICETGCDLAGEEHPHLRKLLDSVHLYVVPILNPDGRSVCPDSFHAQGLDTLTIYASGLTKTGEIVPYDADSSEPLYYFDPDECIFVGGQFNGGGYAINRRRSADSSDAIEVAALFDFVKGRGLHAVIDLHACGYNFAFQARSHSAPYWPVMREWQRRAAALFGSKGRPLNALHGDGNPPMPSVFHFNSSLFHLHAHLMWVAFEGRQGLLGRPSFMPLPTHWEIVDDYLSAVEVFLELGVEGAYARANRECFGSDSGMHT